MSWMRLATAALGVATVVLTQVFVPSAGVAHDALIGAGTLFLGWAMRWPGDAPMTGVHVDDLRG